MSWNIIKQRIKKRVKEFAVVREMTEVEFTRIMMRATTAVKPSLMEKLLHTNDDYID